MHAPDGCVQPVVPVGATTAAVQRASLPVRVSAAADNGLPAPRMLSLCCGGVSGEIWGFQKEGYRCEGVDACAENVRVVQQ